MAVTVPYNSTKYNELQFTPKNAASLGSGGTLPFNYRYEGFIKDNLTPTVSGQYTLIISDISLYPSTDFNISALSMQVNISRDPAAEKSRTLLVYAFRDDIYLYQHCEFLDVGTDMLWTLNNPTVIVYDSSNDIFKFFLPLAVTALGRPYTVQGFYRLYQGNL